MPTRIAQTAEARSVNRDERTIDVVASTFALDSYGTKIDPAGWDLEQFRKNPVITWAHDDRGFTASGGRPIARGENVRVEDGKLKMRLRFPKPGMFPFADEVFNLMADGFLNAVSVGFEPVEWRDEKTESEGNVRVYNKQRLLELAVVTIPSNDEALAERAKTLNADPVEVRMRLEKLREMATETQYSPEDIEKWRSYFEKKQPCNREATKCLERFFKIRGEKQPDDEVEAWKRMAELLEDPAPLTEEEKAKAEEEIKEAIEQVEEGKTTESTEIPVKADEPTVTVEETAEVKTEEPTQPTAPAPEAPEPARKASVLIPLAALQALPRTLKETFEQAAAEALRQGKPRRALPGILDAFGEKLKESFIPTLKP